MRMVIAIAICVPADNITFVPLTFSSSTFVGNVVLPNKRQTFLNANQQTHVSLASGLNW